MEDNNIVKIEIRDSEFYDFFRVPPEQVLAKTGYVFIIARKDSEPAAEEFLFVGSSFDLPRLLKSKQAKAFMELNKATHVLIFRVDPQDEMEMMKEEIIGKYPRILQDLKVKKASRVPDTFI